MYKFKFEAVLSASVKQQLSSNRTEVDSTYVGFTSGAVETTGAGGVAALAMALSSPRDSRNISAPNWWRADMVEGAGSVSGSHSSCVSSVVKSVSVEEWCVLWVGGRTPGLVVVSNLRHVALRSTPAPVPTTQCAQSSVSQTPGNISPRSNDPFLNRAKCTISVSYSTLHCTPLRFHILPNSRIGAPTHLAEDNN